MSQIDEPDDDAARMAWAETKLIGLQIEKLLPLKAQLTRDECRFVERMELHVCVLRKAPTAGDVKQTKELAWKYRRQMPRVTAPKLPPHDPIVQEMEAMNARRC